MSEESGWSKHGILHTSASSINLWNAAPDIFIAEKIFKMKNPVGAAAHRGNAVEKALVSVLAHGLDTSQAIEEALASYDFQTMFMLGEKTSEERAEIPNFVHVGLGALAEFGKPHFEPDGKQKKIELNVTGENGWTLPLIGYTDLEYPQHGLTIDIKTTHKAPSKFSEDHDRQAAIYTRAGGNKAVKFLYITPKKHVWHQCADVNATVAETKRILNEQETFLRAHSREDLNAWMKVYKQMFGEQGRKRFDF